MPDRYNPGRKPLQERELRNPPAVYYTEGFKAMLESHLVWLTDSGHVELLPVKPHIAATFRGDFEGLLFKLDIPEHFHWITMRLNGYTSPIDYDGQQLHIAMVDDKVIRDLERKYITLNRV